MGLDMYLEGRKYMMRSGDKERELMDGFEIKEYVLELGYWRKHPNLHGFIVTEFADGVDNCKPIELNDVDIEKIQNAIKKKSLPMTEGFFFGQSDGTEDEESLEIFDKALKWLRVKDGTWKSIYYEASW